MERRLGSGRVGWDGSAPPTMFATRLRLWSERNWLAVCGLLLMVACEYKWRVRDVHSSLGAQLDLTTFAEIGIFGLVAVYLLDRRSPPLHWRRTALPMGWATAYTAFLALSCLWSPYRTVAAVRAVETCVVLLLAWVATRRGSRAHMHRLAHGFMVLTAASVGVGIVYPMPELPTQIGRFTWLMVHPTASAVFLGIAIVLGVVYLVEWADDTADVRWPRWAYMGLLAVNVGALMANHTRGVVLGVVAALFALMSLLRPIRRRLTGLAFVIWATVLVVLTSADTIIAYFTRGQSASKLATLNERTNLWSVAFDAWIKQPLFGYGLNASRGIFVGSTGLGTGHNAVVNVLVDLGAVGLVIWLTLVVSLVIEAVRLKPLTGANIAVDRAIVISLLTFFVVEGVSGAGIGGVSNVASIWLFLLISWTLLATAHRPRPFARAWGPDADLKVVR